MIDYAELQIARERLQAETFEQVCTRSGVRHDGVHRFRDALAETAMLDVATGAVSERDAFDAAFIAGFALALRAIELEREGMDPS